jgi:uncharacterized protein (TIGR03086 family)
MGQDGGMTDAPLDRFDRAAATATAVIDAVKPDQLDDPTPCTEWNVRQLLNHLIGGTKVFTANVSGGEPVDRSADHVGPDHRESFRAALTDLRTAFAADGALDAVYPGPLGEAPGHTLVRLRVNEMMVHSWDLAKATGQSTDLDPELAAQCLVDFTRLRESGRGAPMFAPMTESPAGASVADQMAAMAGRTV